MVYIILMSLAGTFCQLIHFLIGRRGHLLTRKQSYFLLKAALLFYLLPLFPIEDLYKKIYWKLHPNMPQKPDKIWFERVIQGETVVYRSFWLRMMLYTLVAWLAVSLIIILVRVVRHLITRSKLLFLCREVEDEELLNMAEELRKQMHIRRSIVLYEQDYRIVPMTMGFFKPLILLQSNQPREVQQLILRHELSHIKSGDLLFLLLSQFVKCVHWFNPLVYLLENWMNEACEQACDERVFEGEDIEDKSYYAHLLVKIASGKRVPDAPYPGFSKNGKSMERRLNYLLWEEKTPRILRGIFSVLLAVLIFADSLTVLAYPKIYTTDWEDYYTPNELGNVFIMIPVGADYDNPYTRDVVPIHHDTQFTDGNGVTFHFTDAPGIQHEHSFTKATYTEHILNEDGGCTVYIYDVLACLQCGYKKDVKLVNVQATLICKHIIF